MVPANSQWQRWVLASFVKHLRSFCDPANLPFIVEFVHDRSEAFLRQPFRAEITASGPSTRELSAGVHHVTLDVFAVVSSDFQVDGNTYNHFDKVGALHECLDTCFEVKEYDAAGNPSPATVGVLNPREDREVAVVVTHIKPLESDQRSHSTLEARYTGLFSKG